MKMTAWQCLRGLLITALALVGLAPTTLAAEEATIKAFSVWQGSGHLFQTNVDEATFVGVLAGALYIESEKGPIAAGDITCPAIVTMTIETGAQAGSVRCVIVGDDGSKVFATITCTGIAFVGCRGDFAIVGGDGRFAGITGGGAVLIRSDFSEIAKTALGSLKRDATGILYLPAVTYSIP